MLETKRTPVIIDTDPGIDDASAIFWMLTNPEQFDIKAISVTSGNVGLASCTKNALRLLEATDRTEIPVYVGSYRPILKPAVQVTNHHGVDGMGDCGMPEPTITAQSGYAPAEIARIAREATEPVTVLAIGPLTNIAMAILLDPEFKNNVKEVLYMGGAVMVPGNMSPTASFNVYEDPEAAHIVYNSGIKIVQIGLDCCDKFEITLDDIADIESANSKLSQFVSKMLQFRVDMIGKEPASKFYHVRTNSIPLNDLATTAYLVNPDWFKTEFVPVDIEINGICAGQTVVDFRNHWGKEPNVHFAYDVDSVAAVKRWKTDLRDYKVK